MGSVDTRPAGCLPLCCDSETKAGPSYGNVFLSFQVKGLTCHLTTGACRLLSVEPCRRSGGKPSYNIKPPSPSLPPPYTAPPNPPPSHLPPCRCRHPPPPPPTPPPSENSQVEQHNISSLPPGAFWINCAPYLYVRYSHDHTLTNRAEAYP
jgi:hypothetical protein